MGAYAATRDHHANQKRPTGSPVSLKGLRNDSLSRMFAASADRTVCTGGLMCYWAATCFFLRSGLAPGMGMGLRVTFFTPFSFTAEVPGTSLSKVAPAGTR